jgi:hypothetical protein
VTECVYCQIHPSTSFPDEWPDHHCTQVSQYSIKSHAANLPRQIVIFIQDRPASHVANGVKDFLHKIFVNDIISRHFPYNELSDNLILIYVIFLLGISKVPRFPP